MRIFFTLLIALGLAGCSAAGKTVNPHEPFTVKKGETVNVRGAELKLKMLENGTSQGAPGGDSVFCRVEVSGKGTAEEKTLEAGGFTAYNEWNIRLEKVNIAADPSKASCVFVVARTLG